MTPCPPLEILDPPLLVVSLNLVSLSLRLLKPRKRYLPCLSLPWHLWWPSGWGPLHMIKSRLLSDLNVHQTIHSSCPSEQSPWWWRILLNRLSAYCYFQTCLLGAIVLIGPTGNTRKVRLGEGWNAVRLMAWWWWWWMIMAGGDETVRDLAQCPYMFSVFTKSYNIFIGWNEMKGFLLDTGFYLLTAGHLLDTWLL